ncbi:MAG: secretion protein [Candidatus Anammoximicrobium sp.]|nr:secretion protein [Candidatus Anammoximicrobium sp.]
MALTPLTIITIAAAFCGVAALTAGCLSLLQTRRGSTAEARLDALVKSTLETTWDGAENIGEQMVLPAEDEQLPPWEQRLAQVLDLRLFIRQAGVGITPLQLVSLSALLAVLGGLLGAATQAAVFAAPLGACAAGAIPLLWLFWKRRQRLGKFESQMPDAMDLLARSLRAGHSLADGLRLIGEEMAEPIAAEFHRCYQQQALGVSVEDTLENLTFRVPNLDLRFFVNAVVLQRQTGGDTAEVLDKIARLIRQRFQIRSQVKALTGEGRLSGVVLLAMPIALGIFMYIRNPAYLMILFYDPLGQWMMLTAIVLQIIGAIVIKKIVDIKI